MSSDIVGALDQHLEAKQEGLRPHLGASLIGDKCERKLVYGFRHALTPKHSGRLLRLFGRGHLEELRFVAYLRAIGFEVREYAERLTWHSESDSYATRPWDQPLDPDDPVQVEDVSDDPAHVEMAKRAGVKLKQWGFKDHGGHFAGSGDGEAWLRKDCLRVFEGLNVDEPFLLEFKTHGTKPFSMLRQAETELKGTGESAFRKSKPLHYAQMQVYMRKFGYKRGLYMAVNKNDDDIYTEVVELDEAFADEMIAKAARIIAARQLPPRISNSPAWHECKFCDFRGPCHMNTPLEKKCRTCTNGVAVDGGQWHCAQWAANIPGDVLPVGCNSWSPITD